MTEYEIREAFPDDVEFIIEGMRYHDAQEVRALGSEPYEAVIRGFQTSTRCWTCDVDGVPAVMFGVAPVSILTGLGAPWLLGTNDAKRIPRAFLEEGRAYTEHMLRLYPRLVNLVDVRNLASIRWLKRLGYKFGEAFPAGLAGEMFLPFEMRASDV